MTWPTAVTEMSLVITALNQTKVYTSVTKASTESWLTNGWQAKLI